MLHAQWLRTARLLAYRCGGSFGLGLKRLTEFPFQPLLKQAAVTSRRRDLSSTVAVSSVLAEGRHMLRTTVAKESSSRHFGNELHQDVRKKVDLSYALFSPPFLQAELHECVFYLYTPGDANGRASAQAIQRSFFVKSNGLAVPVIRFEQPTAEHDGRFTYHEEDQAI